MSKEAAMGEFAVPVTVFNLGDFKEAKYKVSQGFGTCFFWTVG